MKNDLKKQFKQQQKKEKAKSILKWVACGVGWTSLLGLFIALLCLGVKGCNNKKQQQASASTIIGDYSLNKAVIGEELYKYYYRYDNDIDDFESATSSSSQDYDLYLHLKIVSNDIEGSNGFYYTANKISLSVSTLEVGSSLSRYITLRAYSNSDNPSMLTLYQKVMLDDEVQNITNNIQVGFLECDNDLSLADYSNNALGYLAGLVKVNAVVNLDYRFDFNSQINRYGVIGQSNTYFGLSNANYIGTSWVIKGYFRDELNNYYTGIRISYAQAQGTGYVDGGYHVFDSTGLQYICLFYIKADGSTVLVNSANYIQYDNKTCYTNSSKWVSDTFRHLTIFYFDEVENPTLPLGQYSPLEVLNTFNNDSLSFSPVGNDDGVFGLLGSAFGSIASILGMQVIPGITIGLLIFIPFSITILLTCVWLFKR